MKCFYQKQRCMAGQHAPDHGNTQPALGEVTCSRPCTERGGPDVRLCGSDHWLPALSEKHQLFLGTAGFSIRHQYDGANHGTCLDLPVFLVWEKNRMRQTRLARPTFHAQLGQGLVASSEQWARSRSIGATYRLRWLEPVCCHHISFNLCHQPALAFTWPKKSTFVVLSHPKLRACLLL